MRRAVEKKCGARQRGRARAHERTCASVTPLTSPRLALPRLPSTDEQFFALFFARDEGLSPIAVASIWVGCPLLIAATTAAAVPLSRRVGRAATAVACDVVGTLCILGLGLGAALPPWAVIAVYLVRTAAMNASYPIQRAILMDLVPKKQRGRWNSLENLTSFTWTGSAALGGVLVDRFGYRFTFLITAALYSAACFLLALLIPLTRGEVCDDENDEAGAGAGAEAGAGAAGAPEEAVAVATGG